MTNLDIAQICKVLEYIKAHEEDPSQLNNSHFIDDKPTNGCDIYSAIEKEEIQLTFDQLNFFFRVSGLIQKTTNNKNFNSPDLQMNKENWQGKLIQTTGLGRIVQDIYLAIQKATSHALQPSHTLADLKDQITP
jgi:hypothetical protein